MGKRRFSRSLKLKSERDNLNLKSENINAVHVFNGTRIPYPEFERNPIYRLKSPQEKLVTRIMQ